MNIYLIYKYNIPFNKYFKKFLSTVFLQNNGNGMSERNGEIKSLQPAEPGKHPKIRSNQIHTDLVPNSHLFTELAPISYLFTELRPYSN